VNSPIVIAPLFQGTREKGGPRPLPSSSDCIKQMGLNGGGRSRGNNTYEDVKGEIDKKGLRNLGWENKAEGIFLIIFRQAEGVGRKKGEKTEGGEKCRIWRPKCFAKEGPFS